MFLSTQVAKWRGINKIDYSVDYFHRGKFVLVQPCKGHRAGIDAMLLAGAVPKCFSGKLVDLGAGAGAAALAVASTCVNAHVTLVENNPLMLECAMRTLNHPVNHALVSRAALIDCDVAAKGKQRVEVGLLDHSFDFVLMNPPFNAPHDRQTPDAVKAAAHVMIDGLWNIWIKTAAALVRPKGKLALIARPASLSDILSAVHGRFGDVRIIPIHSHINARAIRIIIIATRASRASTSLEPALVLHENNKHDLLARADQIINGRIDFFEGKYYE